MHQIQEEIGLPRIIIQSQDGFHAVFTISPLPQGYGITLGNALRRVLLSSLPGTAVNGIKIDNISHEYSSVKGIKDSVLDITLNLKGLHLKKATKGTSVLTLNIKNHEGVIRAKHIKTSSDVEILNPEMYITTAENKNAKLNMEIFVEKGVGFLPITQRESSDPNLILIDAIYSPVLKVRYEVENTRVGQMTDLDKLTLEIETNGAISPENALKFSANILKSYFSLFDQSEMPVEAEFMSDFQKIIKQQKEQEENKPKQQNYTPIEILGLSPRTLNALINNGIGSIEELVKCPESKLNNFRGFGKKAFNEVKNALKNRNLQLSPEEEISPPKA